MANGEILQDDERASPSTSEPVSAFVTLISSGQASKDAEACHDGLPNVILIWPIGSTG